MTAMTFDTPLRSSSASRSSRVAAPVRLTRRGRALLVLLLVSVVLVAFSLGRTSADAGSSRPPAPRTTIVQPGETLWAIAQRVAPGADPRQTIARLTSLNNLDSTPIVAGQKLLLPAT